jgi:DNA-binding MarR family transcriptional regulator
MGLDASAVTSAQFGGYAVETARQRHGELDEAAMRVGFNLTRAANALVQASEESIHRKHGWSWAGFRVMFIIWLFPTIEARNIARLAAVTRQTTSSVLATLERDGLVERARVSAHDRRLLTVRLTRRGQRAVRAAFAEQNAFEQRWFDCLTADEQRTLADLLERVLSHSVHPAGADRVAPEPPAGGLAADEPAASGA